MHRRHDADKIQGKNKSHDVTILRRRGDDGLNFYYCDACHYCFERQSLPDRCPDYGAVEHNDRPAVRPATENEKIELLRIRAEDND